jgi:Flp pilus assembly protein TadD
LSLFTRCVADFPDSTTYRMMLSRSLEQKGDLAGATAQLSAAVQLDPESAALHHKLGAFYLRQGRKAEAQKEFDRSFAIFAPWALGKDSSQGDTSADAK